MTTKLLTESSSAKLTLAEDGTIPVVLITPGKGSSGYYSEDVIKRDCAEAWPAGSHSYVNHIKPGETRDPEKMIGVLAEDAHWDDAKGGAVSRLKPFKHWAPFVEEIAPHAALSISAKGTGKVEEMDGESVYVVESIAPGIINTVDLVSYAGRGGHFTESAQALYDDALGESTHSESAAGANKDKDTNTMAVEDELKALTSTVESLVVLIKESANVTPEPKAPVAEAVDVSKIAESIKAVEESKLPKTVKDELFEGIKTGDLDVAPKIASATKLREEYLAEAKAATDALGATAGGSNSADLYEVGGWA